MSEEPKTISDSQVEKDTIAKSDFPKLKDVQFVRVVEIECLTLLKTIGDLREIAGLERTNIAYASKQTYLAWILEELKRRLEINGIQKESED